MENSETEDQHPLEQVSEIIQATCSCIYFVFILSACSVYVFLPINFLIMILLYPQTKVGDILDSGPSRRRRRRRRRNFLVDAITQKQINIFFSNLVHMLRVSKGRSLF